MNLIIILIPLSVLSIILAYFFVIPFFFGAPYEPSRGKALKSIIKFANPKSRDKRLVENSETRLGYVIGEVRRFFEICCYHVRTHFKTRNILPE